MDYLELNLHTKNNSHHPYQKTSGLGQRRRDKLNVFPKQRERHALHCCWEGHGPKKKTAVGHTGQMAPQAIWEKKKKSCQTHGSEQQSIPRSERNQADGDNTHLVGVSENNISSSENKCGQMTESQLLLPCPCLNFPPLQTTQPV